MTEIESLRAQHAELGRRIEALERGQSKEWPKVGNDYFFIFGSGTIAQAPWLENDADLTKLTIGNCYRTEAEARRGALAAQAMRKLRLWADEDIAAHNSNEYPPGFRCHVGGAITGAPVGPSFATPGSRDRAQAALTKEELEALA